MSSSVKKKQSLLIFFFPTGAYDNFFEKTKGDFKEIFKETTAFKEDCACAIQKRRQILGSFNQWLHSVGFLKRIATRDTIYRVVYITKRR
jgi:hypothetical protein